mgnify:CR=1 FL=1
MHYFVPKRCTESNKIMYHDKATAQQAADQSWRERGTELWVYRCDFCGTWHLTHRDPQSSYMHVPLNQQLKPHSRKKATSPAEGNSRAIAGHNRTIPRTRQHIKPRPGGFIAIHRALLYQPQRYVYTVYRSKRKPCRFACTATALAFTPSSIAFAAIWSLNASTGRSVSRKS